MKLVEVIDLYNLHDNPKSLYGYDRVYNEVPELAWQKYACNKDGYVKSRFTKRELEELKKREYLWAQNDEIAIRYALGVLNDRFPAGEDAIAKVARVAYEYAYYVIKGRWPPGEDAIAKDSYFKSQYAFQVMKDRLFWSKKAKGKIK